MEHTGAEAARPFVERARATFPTVVDQDGQCIALFGFKVVPNGVLVDEQGIIRYIKHGGFSVDNTEDVAAVERFLRGEDPGPGQEANAPYTVSTAEQKLIEAKLHRGRVLLSSGQRDEAVTEWREALRRDPQNMLIRKQIWAALHPEKFYPTIDSGWQKEQFQREQQEEIASGICGPDGCPIPEKSAAN